MSETLTQTFVFEDNVPSNHKITRISIQQRLGTCNQHNIASNTAILTIYAMVKAKSVNKILQYNQLQPQYVLNSLHIRISSGNVPHFQSKENKISSSLTKKANNLHYAMPETTKNRHSGRQNIIDLTLTPLQENRYPRKFHVKQPIKILLMQGNHEQIRVQINFACQK